MEVLKNDGSHNVEFFNQEFSTYHSLVDSGDVNGLFSYLMVQVGESLNTHVLESDNGWDFKFFCKGTGKLLYHMDTFDTGLNSHLAFKRMRNKVTCVDFLLLNKVPTVAHHNVIREYDSVEQELEVFRYLNSHVDLLLSEVGHIIVKPTSGGSGKDIYKVSSFSDFLSVVNELSAKGLDVCYCPFYEFDTEYRYVMLDGEVRLAFGKYKRPDMLQHNLSEGAEVVGIPPELDIQMQTLAKQASRAVNSRFCTVDIINTSEGLKVLELNGSVTIKRVLVDDYSVFVSAKEIYREALVLGAEAGNF